MRFIKNSPIALAVGVALAATTQISTAYAQEEDGVEPPCMNPKTWFPTSLFEHANGYLILGLVIPIHLMVYV
jgi:hypothetical protein